MIHDGTWVEGRAKTAKGSSDFFGWLLRKESLLGVGAAKLAQTVGMSSLSLEPRWDDGTSAGPDDSRIHGVSRIVFRPSEQGATLIWVRACSATDPSDTPFLAYWLELAHSSLRLIVPESAVSAAPRDYSAGLKARVRAEDEFKKACEQQGWHTGALRERDAGTVLFASH